jgi:uncharacterized cupin superfamily protein
MRRCSSCSRAQARCESVRSDSLRQGDVIACPPGGHEAAHQIINTGEVDLRYLAVSTKLSPEIAEYPDSNKFGVLGELPGDGGAPEVFRFLGRAETSLGCYGGEPEE